MSINGSQRGLNMTVRRTGSRSDENAPAYPYARSEMVVQRGDNGYAQEYMESGYSHNLSRQSISAGQVSNMSSIQQQISFLQSQCQDFLDKAAYSLQNGNDSRALAEADNYLASASDVSEQLRGFAFDLSQQNVPTENIMRSVNIFTDQIRELSAALNGPQQQKWTTRTIRRSVSREEPNRYFTEAMGWITQQKRLIETSSWGEDMLAIEQQITNHIAFQSSIQRSVVVDRARADLMRAKDQNADVNKSYLNKMEQEWDSLQKASYQRGIQLQELRTIIEEISNQIMWVNDREEEELVFDWGDKNIDAYILKKEESFSKLMSELELKEIDLNVLKGKVDTLLKNKHPASDKIQAYMETLQTQWSWLLQITKCINVHLKGNAQYSQFFKETTDMNAKLQKEHDNIRKNFSVDKSTPLHSLLELIQGLERERERLTQQREMVQQLVMKSKNIIRLKPRNPEEKITSQSHVLVRALCDFRQDEMLIRKGDEGILKDNSERTTWKVTGPGGMDMQVPSVCLLVPPPNPLAISLANKNSQYYEAILTVWNQLYINTKSMISWQYCLLDINRINSLTIAMLAKMGPEESMSIIKSLEMHFQEFKKHAQGSELFGEEDKKTIETQYSGAQKHYGKLAFQLPTYTVQGEGSEYSAAVSVKLLNELHALRFKLDGAESSLVSFLYIPIGENAPDECARHISNTQVFQKDVESLRGEFLKLQDSIQAELKDAKDTDKAKYLSGQLDFINQRLVNLDNYTGTHLQRLNSLKSLLKIVLRTEDVVKVYEARLTEKETASLDPEEIQKYQNVLKNMHSDLEQKQDVLNSLVAELSNVHQFNEQMDQGRYRCIINLSQYAEHVNQLSDRWKRIQIQIKSRLVDLDAYLPQLQRYLNSSSNLSGWIDETQRHIYAQQTMKTDDITVYTQLLNQQKALNSDIKAKRELVETAQKDGEACIEAIKNYELELASYGAGLETLLNIPIKRSVLQSPSSTISEEVSSLNAHYLELLTHSSEYYKLLVVSSKNIEELKIRNTKIELLEEELQQLRDTIKDHNATNASLQEALIKYQQELSDSQQHLLSLEEVKRSQTLKCMVTQESLDSSENHLQELMEQIRRLKIQLEDVERKKKIVEDRYKFLQEEYDETMCKKLKELEQASWAKMELEKTVSVRTREVERLRRELEEEARRVKEAQAELAKVRQEHSIEIREVKQTYESQILVTQTSMERLSQQQESDSASMSLEYERLEGESRELKEQLKRLHLSLSQEEAQRRNLEEEVKRLSNVGTEEGQKRLELEAQLQLILSQKGEAENKWKKVQESSNRTLQEKNNEINHLTRCLDEVQRMKKALETETKQLEGELTELKAKNKTSNEELVQLRSSHLELSLIRVELEAHALEKGQSEQTISQLQSRIQELQEELKRLESELVKQRQVAEEEAGKCRRTEMQLEKSSQAMCEYTSTITTLRKSQEETSLEAKQADKELKQLQETLDRTFKEHKALSQSLAALKAEMNTLKLQLKQEQGRVQDANKRYEALHRSMEEKTTTLNPNTVEIERLQRMNETLAKECLRLEEELRGVRLEHEELLKGKKHEDQEMAEQITALQKQLDASQRAGAEHDRLIRQLSQEREKLQQEIENVQKQASETSSVIQISQSQCTELQQERDALIKKIKTMEQDVMRLKKLEEELASIKLSLESELRMKSQLQEEKDRINKDFTQWKIKCDTHEEKIQQHNSERSALESQFNSVKSEMESLRALLSETEERYRLQLQALELERTEMQLLRSSQQKPDGTSKYTQTDQSDSSSLVFDGVRKKVTAQQLLDCGVIDKGTFAQLIKGERTVQDVAVDIRLNLKGTGAIAGLEGGPKGKMTFTEAKKQQLISDECANMLLEAQAATGYMIDPRANVKMTVEEACQNGIMDEADKKQLLIAEFACIGFRDPKTAKLLSASQAMRKGIINRDTALRLLQAQEAAGGILDPILSVYLSKDTAMDRDLIDDDLYQALNAVPVCYIDPVTGLHANYVTLKKRCKADLTTSLLMLPAPEKPMTVQGLRAEVSVSDLVDAKLLEHSDMENLREGKITSQDIEHRLRAYLRGSTCIAGVYDEANDCTLTIYQAMKNGLLRPGTTLELLEAQAASGFMINPINNEYYTVEEACKKGLAGVEFKDKLLSAERAVSGFKDPGTNKIISLFEAIEHGIIEKGHGIRLLEAQIASGGIIDPKHSHRIDVDVAYQRGYFGEKMNQILKDEGDETKGFFDPNTEDNLTYLQLKSRCITDKKTGLVLLPLHDKRKSQQKNSTRKRRVLIVDPDSNKEMTVREAYEKKLIDYQTFLELSRQECEWEETIITAPDGSTSTAIMDMQTGIQYDLKELLDKGVIDQDVFDKYRSGEITVTQLADMITNKAKNLNKPLSSTASISSFTSQTALTSQTIKSETIQTVQSVSTQQDPSSTNSAKHISSMSVKLAPLVETIEEQNPVGAIFYTEKLEKISICNALKRGILDSITAQRLLEAQACTGGVVNPENGRRMSIQEATRLGVLDDEMANRLKPAQKAYIGFEDVKTKRKMSAAEAVKEKWLPYEAGQRFLEFQYLTGGLLDPELGCRRTLEEALQLGWLDMRGAQRLQDTRHHPKTLTCPKTKLRISYKEALEGCMKEEDTGVRMLPAATVSSHGISSPYNLSNPGSAPGSRSGSQSGSRRGSVDYGLSPSSSTRYSSFSYNRTSFSSRSLS
ncbi:desmoplakin-like isoform X1 [Myxocyprinus asiaticus]|uniref:desmoplakin-like isoform X1 n=1 Tax=Myxocyprinus asiaticus TaxID=70543 RepID=UPI00222297E3|nr:desmoplakin-like isoform X1 [Myxocyprinus asiaticus]